MAKITVGNSFFDRQIQEEPALVRLSKCRDIPTKASYWLSRILKELSGLNTVYMEEKQKIIEKWAMRDADGVLKTKWETLNEDGTVKTEENTYKFGDHGQDFSRDFIELLNIENELPFEKVALALDKVPSGVLNAYDYQELEPFVDFEE
jgi:hypothetical protein